MRIDFPAAATQPLTCFTYTASLGLLSPVQHYLYRPTYSKLRLPPGWPSRIFFGRYDPRTGTTLDVLPAAVSFAAEIGLPLHSFKFIP